LIDKVKYNVYMADFLKIAPHSGAMTYFDSCYRKYFVSILSNWGGFCRNL